MQENEFEKSIREKMGDLQLTPSEDVWKRVAADIQKEKREKRFLFFLLSFIFLAGSAGFYLFTNSTKTQTVLATENNTSTSGISSPKKDRATNDMRVEAPSHLSTQPGDTLQAKAFLQTKRNKTLQGDQDVRKNEIGENKQAVKANAIEKANDIVETTTRRSLNSAKDIAAINIKKYKPEPGSKKRVPEVKKTTAFNDESVPDHRVAAEQKNELKQNAQPGINTKKRLDSLNEIPSQKQAIKASADSSKPIFAETKSIQKKNIAENKKWSIGIAAFSGLSNNISNLNNSALANSNYSSSPSPNTTGSLGSSTINRLSYKSGFSYGFGLYIKKHLGKRLGVSAGLNYRFETASSLIGNRVNTTRTFYDVAMANSQTVNEYYNSGNSVNYRNKYYQIELPLNLLIRINRNENKAILFTTGVAPGYLVSTDALYANTTQNTYYASSGQFRKWQLSTQAGIYFTILNAHHFNITAGPELRYGLINISKPAINTNQHLSSASAKVNINFLK